MWLGLLWVITMFIAFFTTFSFSGPYLHALMVVLFGISVLLTLRSQRRIAYVWFGAATTACLIIDVIRSLT